MRYFIPVIFTLIIAMFLTLLPMPPAFSWARPAWLLLLLIYWTMTQPYHINVGISWVVGLYLDITSGTMLGEHALAMTVVIYLVYHFHQRIKMYSMLQQSLCVALFVLIYQAIIYCVQGFVGEEPLSRYYWLSTLTSMVLWPWLAVILRDYSRWFRLSAAK